MGKTGNAVKAALGRPATWGFALIFVMLFATAFLFFWAPDSVSAAKPCYGQAPKADTQVEALPADKTWAFYDRPNQAPAVDPKAPPAKQVQLALLPEQSTTLQFGRSQAVRAMDVDYKLSLQGTAASEGKALASAVQAIRPTPIQLDLLQFKRADGEVLNPALVMAKARMVGDRVRVTLCVNRTVAGELGEPGTYQGGVAIIDPRIARVDLPLVVEASYPHLTRVVSLVLLALLAGSWVTWVVKERKRDDYKFRPSDWAAWMVTAIGIITLVAGGAAALALFNTTYLNSATWGSSMFDFFTLVSGAFVAFMGATTGLHVATLAEINHRQQVGRTSTHTPAEDSPQAEVNAANEKKAAEAKKVAEATAAEAKKAAEAKQAAEAKKATDAKKAAEAKAAKQTSAKAADAKVAEQVEAEPAEKTADSATKQRTSTRPATVEHTKAANGAAPPTAPKAGDARDRP